MNLRLKRTPGLYLVGFMGSGKTAIGRHLAHRLGWNFFDLEREIEAAEKTIIGEAEFRRIESEMLQQHVRAVERGRPAVLVLGDGAFVDAANRELILQNGIAIWLDCPPDRAQAAVCESRREIYALADVRIVMASDSAEDAVEAILSHPILK